MNVVNEKLINDSISIDAKSAYFVNQTFYISLVNFFLIFLEKITWIIFYLILKLGILSFVLSGILEQALLQALGYIILLLMVVLIPRNILFILFNLYCLSFCFIITVLILVVYLVRFLLSVVIPILDSNFILLVNRLKTL